MQCSRRAILRPPGSGKPTPVALCHLNWISPANKPIICRISPPHKRLNGRKPSSASIVMIHEPQQRHRLIPRLQNKEREKSKDRVEKADAAETDANLDPTISRIHSKESGIAGGTGSRTRGSKWIMGICFRGQKVLRVPSASSVPPESVVFELSEQ